MKASIETSLSILATAIALTGCTALEDPTVGRGPVTLSAAADQAFADYRAKRTPRYFALSTDGQAFYYSYCDAGRCLRQPKTAVIDKCQSFSDGVPCKIYASHGKIIWTKNT